MQQRRLKEKSEGNLCGPKEGKPWRPGVEGDQPGWKLPFPFFLAVLQKVKACALGRLIIRGVFGGYSGGIRRVFGGIPIIFKVFGRVAIFADIAVTTPAVLSDPPKLPFYNIKRG